MTEEERLERLATEDLTDNQLGAIMGEFKRLGFSERTTRPWPMLKDEIWLGRSHRLDITSCLVGRDVDSTWELKMGEAGKLYNDLLHCQTLDDLFALLPEDFEFSPDEGDAAIYWTEDEDESPEEASPGEMFKAGWQLICKSMSSWLS